MESFNPLLFEISLDEKASFGGTGKGGSFADGADHDLLAELLGEVGRVKDHPDDLVFVSEMFTIPQKSRLSSPKPTIDNGCVDEDDDDCVVLDGDPDKPAAVDNVRADDYNSDDLVVVDEKGQVACRDFPHPRHLCAKFLFASTSHEVHCSQCHCYVCDSLAPCAHWGSGICGVDHCNASDKEEYWRAQRKRMKKGDKHVPVLSSFNDVSFSAGLPLTSQVPAFAPSQHNFLLSNQVLGQVGSLNVDNQCRRHLPGFVFPKYKAQPQLHNRMVTLLDNNHIAGNIGPEFIPPRAVFKRPGFIGASPNNRRGNAKNFHGSQLSRGPVLKRWHTPLLNSYHGFNLHNIGSLASNFALPQPKLSAPQSMDVGYANYLHSQPQIHSQPYLSCLTRDPIPCQPQLPSQTIVSSNFVNEVHLQSQVASLPNVGNFNNRNLPQPNDCIPSQTLASNQSDAGIAFENQLHSRSMISSHPDMGNSCENQSSQFQSCSTPTCTLVDDQNNFQQGSQTQNGLFTSPDSLEFQFGGWMFENPSLPEGMEDPMPPGFDAFSPGPAYIDEGTLFYF